MATAPGRVAASQLDQLLLDVPLDLDLVRARRLGLPVDRRLEALGNELLAYPSDRPKADAEGLGDVFVGAVLPVGVGQQQDAGVRQLACRCFPGGNKMFQPDPLLRRQCDPILVHRRTPVSWGVAWLSS